MSRLTIRLPARDYLALDADALERELQAFVQARRPNDVNSFFEGDTARILIEFLAFIGDTLSYNVGRVGEESFLATARERDSALRHAATFAYPTRTITPATATLVPDSFLGIDERITSRVCANAIQRLTITVTGGAPSGSFTLTYGAEVSIPVPYPVDLTGVRDALGSLSQIGVDNVSVTNPQAGVFDIEFVESLRFTPISNLVVTPTLTDVTAVISSIQTGVDDSLDAVFNAGDVYSSGGLSWEVMETVTVVGRDVTADNYADKYAIPVAEGASFSESFVSNGRAFQIWTSSADRVVASTLEVRFGDENSTPWERVDTIAIATADQEAYEVRFDTKDRIVLRFGDGITGKIPPDGALALISGRSANGTKGNVGVRGVRASLRCTTDDGGTPVQFTVSMSNPSPANGGADSESLDELRRNIPRWVRTVDKALTKEDYDTQASLFDSEAGTVARAASYLSSATVLYQTSGDPITPSNPLTIPENTLLTFGSRVFSTSRELVVNETDPILFFNPNVVYVYLWSLGASGFEGANDVLRAAVRVYLQERSVITTTIQTLAGRQHVIDVNLGEVTYDGSYDETSLRATITSVVQSFFVSDAINPGTPFRLSDFYNVLENTPGVSHFVIQTPSADVEIAKDAIAVLGTLTFTLTPMSIPLDDDVNARTFGDEIFH